MKSVVVLKILLVIAQIFVLCTLADSPTEDKKDEQVVGGTSTISESGRVLWGKGRVECEEDLPTLSVATENLINTKAEWDQFVKDNPFFIVGAADSKCKLCCD